MRLSRPTTSPATRADLESCAREPIHVPGSIQPHGVLLALSAADMRVVRVSANCASLLGREPDALIGRDASDALGPQAASTLTQATADPARRMMQTLVSLWIGDAELDALVHFAGELIVVELLRPGGGPRPLTFTDTYRRAQATVAQLDAMRTYGALVQATARQTRELTGFDRVMVYRFDERYNGEVVAEDKRSDLAPFLGLRYPASDIPAQARTLYERNWLRLIADVAYEPSPILPLDAEPLDLSRSWLRSVSPVHVEYLQNMGVAASMSVSLMIGGRLWGLIACHHYDGPLEPGYEVSATIELLAQVVSSRIADRLDQRRSRAELGARARLSDLAVAGGGSGPLAPALTSGSSTLLDLVRADGVVADLDGERVTVGTVPEPDVVARIAALAEDEPRAVESLTESGIDAGDVAGALIVGLDRGQHVTWFRREHPQVVEWGGDPNAKEYVTGDDGRERLSPRRSFERWREETTGRCTPWAEGDLQAATLLRAQLIEALYSRTRAVAEMALGLQRSLLPERLPEREGWHAAARYLPAAGGRVGGDWYDGVALADGRLGFVVGDVAGHGLSAAGTMGQLRTALRAALLEQPDAVAALQRLDRFVTELMPDAFATCLLAIVDPAAGTVELASCGHPAPVRVDVDGRAELLDVRASPPLGVFGFSEPPAAVRAQLSTGETLVLFTDGVFERRDESGTAGLDRVLAAAGHRATPDEHCDTVIETCRAPDSDDDATVLVIQRSP